MKNITKRLAVFMLCLTFCMAGFSVPSSQQTTAYGATKSISVTMLNVNQGLCLLIKADGKYMLYDGGGRETSSYVVSYLKKHNIKKLTYLVASHYDEDHIAGLVGVLKTTKVYKALTPNYKADTKIYTSFKKALKENGATVKHPKKGQTYKLGNAKIRIVGPKSYKETDENNRSIAVRITYGNFSIMITGDAETEEESWIIKHNSSLKSTIYVLGHHGSSSSSSTAFLNTVKPKYAFLSCGKGNSYGHPTAQTLKRLKKRSIKLYRTDSQGAITVTYKNKKLSFSKSATKNWKSGTAYANADSDSGTKETTSGDSGTYVLNTSSKKFHLPGCSAVSQMSEKNKVYSSESRSELISEGYSPCGICNP